ncbi:MAG: DUF5932 domain-containing protein [Bacteroidaceae bacterium]|nr:DUF5932 domain-containing protein [Bacteroidaceae bacterium]
MENFKVIIVEDVKLELKGTEGIFKNEIPEATIIGTAQSETEFWGLMRDNLPDLVLLDLGLGGSTTVGVDICKQIKKRHKEVKVLIFTGEIMNERLWVDALKAGADGIILKCGELLTKGDVMQVISGKRMVFNQPILEKILLKYTQQIDKETRMQDAEIDYELDEYDIIFLKHLALGYTKDMIANLKNMPFGVKSLEKRQNDLITRLFGENSKNINATRLVTKAFQLGILNVDNLEED